MAKTTRTTFQFDGTETMERDGVTIIERALIVDDFGGYLKLTLVGIYGLATTEIVVPNSERESLAAAILGQAETG